MHSQLALILAIAATTLALPTTNQTSPDLEKRYYHGWIGSHGDDKCGGAQIGPRPEVHLNDCTAFAIPPGAQSFTMFDGSGWYAFNQFYLYADSECKHALNGGKPFDTEPYATSDYYGCAKFLDVGLFGSFRPIGSDD